MKGSFFVCYYVFVGLYALFAKLENEDDGISFWEDTESIH